MLFEEILKIKGFKPGEFRLVRHAYREIDPLALYQSDRPQFEAYQAFQKKGRFAKARYIASFAPYHGTQALFLGVWRIDGEITPCCNAPVEQRRLVKHFNWPQDDTYYELTEQEAFCDLAERLVIDWGGSTVSWVQTKTNKEVVAILPPNSIKEFVSYDSAVLTHHDLIQMIKNPTSNHTWLNALRAVNGIYCITDIRNGRNYVGSAYGKDGIWGRWANYVHSGHGGNKMLVELLQAEPDCLAHFQYSILEILPGSSTAEDAINKESLWKQKLGSRFGGYNYN